MRTAVALLLAVAVAGCGGDATTTLSPQPGVVGSPSTLSVGETVAFSMHTHCGVEGAQINGRVWNAVEPLYSSPDRLGPPAGWGNPFQEGSLTLESSDRAVFSALGQRVELEPSPTGEPLRPCD